MNTAKVMLRGGSRSSAYLDLTQALSGVLLSLFMLGHTFFVFSIVFGANFFDKLANFFESTNLAQIGGPLIGFLFLLHFFLAARKVPFTTYEQKIVWRQAIMLKHLDTWLWLVQVITGMLILLLGSIHIWVILNDLPITALKSKELLREGLWLYFNLLFLLCVALHLGIGLYRVGAKWGFVTRANRLKVKKIVWGLIGGLILLDLISLFRFYFL